LLDFSPVIASLFGLWRVKFLVDENLHEGDVLHLFVLRMLSRLVVLQFFLLVAFFWKVFCILVVADLTDLKS